MMNKPKKIYFKILLFLKHSDYLRQKIAKSSRYKITKATIDYLNADNCSLSVEEKSGLKKHLSNNLISQINYPFVNEYLLREVKVCFDKNNSMHYVYHENKKLYFKKNMSKTAVTSLYNTLCIERDIRSPHSYNSFNINYQPEDIAIDAGAAEGIWSLDMVEKVKELYVFECEDEWIEALNATFAPWKDKVHIIKKFISNKTDGENIRLDNYFIEKNIFPTILKADIEGSEIALTEGSPELLSKYLQHVILCVYHNESDYRILSSTLQDCNFKTLTSKGYMTMVWSGNGNYSAEKDVSRIFRKGLIYGFK